MAALEPQFFVAGRGDEARRIAYAQQQGGAPGIVWLQGFKSEMVSIKATALAEWTAAKNLAYLRFDYSGHGMSDGRFEDGTISRWLEEAIAIFEHLTQGPQILVGSSMGGYISLLMLRHFMEAAPQTAERIKRLVLIAPAWNMTHDLIWPRFPEEAKHEINTHGVWQWQSQYGDDYPITRNLIEDGAGLLIDKAPWNPGRPVNVLHGRLDPDVPYGHSERLGEIIYGSPYYLEEIPDGEHRLSRPEDLDVLLSVIARAVSGCA